MRSPIPLKGRGQRRSGMLPILLGVSIILFYIASVHYTFGLMEGRLRRSHEEEKAKLRSDPKSKANTVRNASETPETSLLPPLSNDMDAVKEAVVHVRRVTKAFDSVFPLKTYAIGRTEFQFRLEVVGIKLLGGEDVNTALSEAENLWLKYEAQEHTGTVPLALLEAVSGFTSLLGPVGASMEETSRWKEREDMLYAALEKEVERDLKPQNGTAKQAEGERLSPSTFPTDVLSSFAERGDARKGVSTQLFEEKVVKAVLDFSLRQKGGGAQRYKDLLKSFIASTEYPVSDSAHRYTWLLHYLLLSFTQCGDSTAEKCQEYGDLYEGVVEVFVAQLVRTLQSGSGAVKEVTFAGMIGGLGTAVWLPVLDRSTCAIPSVLAAGVHAGVHTRAHRLEGVSLTEHDVLEAAENLMSTCIRLRGLANVTLLLRDEASPSRSGPSIGVVQSSAPTGAGMQGGYEDEHRFRTALLRDCYVLYSTTRDSLYGHLARDVAASKVEGGAPPLSSSLRLDWGETADAGRLPPEAEYIAHYLRQQRYFALLFSFMDCVIYKRKNRGICSLFTSSTLSLNGHLMKIRYDVS